MFDYRGHFVTSNTPASGLLFANSVTLHAHDATDLMDDDKFVTVLESFVNTSLQLAQVNTIKVSGLGHLILAKN